MVPERIARPTRIAVVRPASSATSHSAIDSATSSRLPAVQHPGAQRAVKSTLRRIASGLQPESSGRVETTTDQMGHVFQDATLLP